MTALRGAAPTGAAPYTGVSQGAVDVLDIAARLEASGMTDRAARAHHGVPDVFTLAATLRFSEADRSASPAGRRAARSEVGEALRRAVLLVAGVLLAGAVLGTLRLDATIVWTVGVTGWIGGQSVSAIAWSRLGWGQGAAGLRRGGAAALPVLVVAALLPAVISRDASTAVAGTLLALAWVGYAAAVSLLVCARRTHLALVTVLTALALVGLVLVADRTWSPAAVLGIAAAGSAVVVALAGQAVRRAGGPVLPGRIDLRSAAPAALQASMLATSLLLLLRTVPENSATAVVVASVVGAALTDPAIAVLRSRLRSSAGRIYAVSLAARHARRAAVLAAASTATASAVVALVVILALRAGTQDWPTTMLPAAAFTAVATIAAALTAFGAPWRAALAAAAAVVYAATALLSPTVALAVVFPVVLLVAVTLLLHRVSDPRVVV